MSNVIQHQTVVWSELKKWCDKEQAKAADARACWPEIATRMARLRRDYPSNEEFGAALVMHGIEYNTHDRAAFIWMGALKPAALEDALAKCDRRSPRTFRSEVESWEDEYFNPFLQHCKDDFPTTPSEQKAPTVQPNTQESAPAKSSEATKSGEGVNPAGPMDRRIALVQKLPEDAARALLEHYSDSQTRSMLGKISKPALIELAAIAKSGRLGQVNASVMHKFSARVLVPELPPEWTRGRSFKPTDIKNIKALIAETDRFIAMRDAGCRTKADCDRWWADNVARRKAVDVTASAAPTVTASGDAVPVVVHGKTIWPRPTYVRDADKYTRGTAVAMFHLWQDLNRTLAVSEPSRVGRARIIANLARWVRDGANEQAGAMLQEMAFAQQSDETGAAETSRLTFVNGDTVG